MSLLLLFGFAPTPTGDYTAAFAIYSTDASPQRSASSSAAVPASSVTDPSSGAVYTAALTDYSADARPQH